MEIININRPIQIDDEEFLQLQMLIQAKRQMLINKQKKIKKIAKQNAFLEQVKNDYALYNNFIIKQKQEQLNALTLLNNYISDLSRSGELSENNLKDAKHEQNKIKRELKLIKQGLDKLMNDTNDLNTTLKDKKILL
jgi:hypothetical protein